MALEGAESKSIRARLPPTVVGLGVVSLLTDVSSEAIFPLLPAFLVSLGASNAMIGVVEGAADLVANILKYASGLLADRRSRLKGLVLAGYSVSTVMRPLVGLATAPWQVLVIRVGDRLGKGVRTSPRDALIAVATPAPIRGRAYGFHRAMDHAGAALGTLLAGLLLWSLGAGFTAAPEPSLLRTVFLWAAVPGLAALVALALTPEPAHAPRAVGGGETSSLSPALKRALLPLVLFAAANATDAFLIVFAVRLGAPTLAGPLLWLELHVVKACTATTGGRLADRFGRREALAAGWTVYALTWAAIGFAPSVAVLFGLVAVYGVSHGLVEGAERALVAELAPVRKGRAFGLYNMAVGVAALLASTAFGAVWDSLGSRLAFGLWGALAGVAAAVLLAIVPRTATCNQARSGHQRP